VPATPTPPSLVELISKGVLDAELAALVWLLVAGDVPLVAAAPAGRLAAGAQLVTGVLATVRPDIALEGLDRPLGASGAVNIVRGRRAGGVVEAGSLEEVRSALGAGPLPLSEDQLSFLGCVLVLAPTEPAASRSRGRLRVVAAHYVRPLARDAHGHAQLLPPAVLATWDERLGRYEHFAWGVLPEIAARLNRRTGDLEGDLHHRRDDLAGLVSGRVTALADVQRLVAGYRIEFGGHHGSPSN